MKRIISLALLCLSSVQAVFAAHEACVYTKPIFVTDTIDPLAFVTSGFVTNGRNYAISYTERDVRWFNEPSCESSIKITAIAGVGLCIASIGISIAEFNNRTPQERLEDERLHRNPCPVGTLSLLGGICCIIYAHRCYVRYDDYMNNKYKIDQILEKY